MPTEEQRNNNLKKINTWIQFVSSLPICITNSNTDSYSTEDWIRHYEILLQYSLCTEYYERYVDYYIKTLKHKLNPYSDVIIHRYVCV